MCLYQIQEYYCPKRNCANLVVVGEPELLQACLSVQNGLPCPDYEESKIPKLHSEHCDGCVQGAHDSKLTKQKRYYYNHRDQIIAQHTAKRAQMQDEETARFRSRVVEVVEAGARPILPASASGYDQGVSHSTNTYTYTAEARNTLLDNLPPYNEQYPILPFNSDYYVPTVDPDAREQPQPRILSNVPDLDHDQLWDLAPPWPSVYDEEWKRYLWDCYWQYMINVGYPDAWVAPPGVYNPDP